jgi:protein-S-isoprenylcysteine O-methyltransferase Ste14
MVLIKRIIKIVLAMSGILIDKITRLRIILLTSIGAGYVLHHFLYDVFNVIHALVYFLFFFVTRYIFLFASFSPKGISQKLILKFGERKGYEIYQFITALMFFLGAASYSLLVTKTAGFFFSFLDKPTLVSFGFIVFTTGMIVNVWSTLVVGIDIYYYKDLFLGKPVCEFKKKGPYLFLSNPMYGLGQASGYGTAIMYASLAGVIAIFLNQLMMYIFYMTVEKPHIKKIFNESIQNKVSLPAA